MKKAQSICLRLVIGCLAAATTFLVGHTAQAAWTYSHRWSNRLFKISTVGAGSMATAMTNAANDYSANTVLDLNSSGGQIYGSEGSYGPTGYIGYTYPFNSAGSNCYIYPTIVPTGACNTTTSKAASATIYFNLSYGAYPSKEWLARHEIGHVWGLYHPNCTDPVTVMYSTSCNNFQTTIQADEKNWINTNY